MFLTSGIVGAFYLITVGLGGLNSLLIALCISSRILFSRFLFIDSSRDCISCVDSFPSIAFSISPDFGTPSLQFAHSHFNYLILPFCHFCASEVLPLVTALAFYCFFFICYLLFANVAPILICGVRTFISCRHSYYNLNSQIDFCCAYSYFNLNPLLLLHFR